VALSRLAMRVLGHAADMSDEQRKPAELSDEELDAENGELLPDREEMAIVDPGGDALPGLGPPDLSDPTQ
jgi:hypothetical protein